MTLNLAEISGNSGVGAPNLDVVAGTSTEIFIRVKDTDSSFTNLRTLDNILISSTGRLIATSYDIIDKDTSLADGSILRMKISATADPSQVSDVNSTVTCSFTLGKVTKTRSVTVKIKLPEPDHIVLGLDNPSSLITGTIIPLKPKIFYTDGRVHNGQVDFSINSTNALVKKSLTYTLYGKKPSNGVISVLLKSGNNTIKDQKFRVIPNSGDKPNPLEGVIDVAVGDYFDIVLGDPSDFSRLYEYSAEINTSVVDVHGSNSDAIVLNARPEKLNPEVRWYLLATDPGIYPLKYTHSYGNQQSITGSSNLSFYNSSTRLVAIDTLKPKVLEGDSSPTVIRLQYIGRDGRPIKYTSDEEYNRNFPRISPSIFPNLNINRGTIPADRSTFTFTLTGTYDSVTPLNNTRTVNFIGVGLEGGFRSVTFTISILAKGSTYLNGLIFYSPVHTLQGELFQKSPSETNVQVGIPLNLAVYYDYLGKNPQQVKGVDSKKFSEIVRAEVFDAYSVSGVVGDGTAPSRTSLLGSKADVTYDDSKSTLSVKFKEPGDYALYAQLSSDISIHTINSIVHVAKEPVVVQGMDILPLTGTLDFSLHKDQVRAEFPDNSVSLQGLTIPLQPLDSITGNPIGPVIKSFTGMNQSFTVKLLGKNGDVIPVDSLDPSANINVRVYYGKHSSSSIYYTLGVKPLILGSEVDSVEDISGHLLVTKHQGSLEVTVKAGTFNASGSDSVLTIAVTYSNPEDLNSINPTGNSTVTGYAFVKYLTVSGIKILSDSYYANYTYDRWRENHININLITPFDTHVIKPYTANISIGSVYNTGDPGDLSNIYRPDTIKWYLVPQGDATQYTAIASVSSSGVVSIDPTTLPTNVRADFLLTVEYGGVQDQVPISAISSYPWSGAFRGVPKDPLQLGEVIKPLSDFSQELGNVATLIGQLSDLVTFASSILKQGVSSVGSILDFIVNAIISLVHNLGSTGVYYLFTNPAYDSDQERAFNNFLADHVSVLGTKVSDFIKRIDEPASNTTSPGQPTSQNRLEEIIKHPWWYASKKTANDSIRILPNNRDGFISSIVADLTSDSDPSAPSFMYNPNGTPGSSAELRGLCVAIPVPYIDVFLNVFTQLVQLWADIEQVWNQIATDPNSIALRNTPGVLSNALNAIQNWVTQRDLPPATGLGLTSSGTNKVYSEFSSTIYGLTNNDHAVDNGIFLSVGGNYNTASSFRSSSDVDLRRIVPFLAIQNTGLSTSTSRSPIYTLGQGRYRLGPIENRNDDPKYSIDYEIKEDIYFSLDRGKVYKISVTYPDDRSIMENPFIAAYRNGTEGNTAYQQAVSSSKVYGPPAPNSSPVSPFSPYTTRNTDPGRFYTIDSTTGAIAANGAVPNKQGHTTAPTSGSLSVEDKAILGNSVTSFLVREPIDSLSILARQSSGGTTLDSLLSDNNLNISGILRDIYSPDYSRGGGKGIPIALVIVGEMEDGSGDHIIDVRNFLSPDETFGSIKYKYKTPNVSTDTSKNTKEPTNTKWVHASVSSLGAEGFFRTIEEELKSLRQTKTAATNYIDDLIDRVTGFITSLLSITTIIDTILKALTIAIQTLTTVDVYYLPIGIFREPASSTQEFAQRFSAAPGLPDIPGSYYFGLTMILGIPSLDNILSMFSPLKRGVGSTPTWVSNLTPNPTQVGNELQQKWDEITKTFNSISRVASNSSP